MQTIASNFLISGASGSCGCSSSSSSSSSSASSCTTCSLSGDGSPEGVYAGPPGTIYTDTTAYSLWTKISGTGNTGWAQLIA